MRARGACDVKARDLPDEVVVRRGMEGEVAPDEFRVLIDRDQPALAKSPALVALEETGVRSTQQLPCRRPVDEPQRRLERARPVHAHAEWACGEPAVELLAQRLRMTLLCGERVRLRESDEVQVAVRLPEILAVADAR